MKLGRTMLSLSYAIALALPLTSCGGKVKVKSDSSSSSSGSSVSMSADVNISTAKQGAEAECEEVLRLATQANSKAQMLGMFLDAKVTEPNIDRKISEIKQTLDKLQAMPISAHTVNSIRSEYILMMRTALQPVENWSVGKAEAQRDQVGKAFVKQQSKANDFRIQRMFLRGCKG